MTLAFWFWLLMVLWLIFGTWIGWRDRKDRAVGTALYLDVGWGFGLWLILAIIGLQIFSDPFSTLVK